MARNAWSSSFTSFNLFSFRASAAFGSSVADRLRFRISCLSKCHAFIIQKPQRFHISIKLRSIKMNFYSFRENDQFVHKK